MAAKLAVVEYGVEDLEPPILSVEEAVRRSSFIEVPASLYPEQVGDISKGMNEADHKITCSKVLLLSSIYGSFWLKFLYVSAYIQPSSGCG